MNLRSGRRGFYVSILGAFAALLLTSTLAHAQAFYALEWREVFNNSVGNEVEDNWVANSYTAASGGTRIVSISLPIAASFGMVQYWVTLRVPG